MSTSPQLNKVFENSLEPAPTPDNQVVRSGTSQVQAEISGGLESRITMQADLATSPPLSSVPPSPNLDGSRLIEDAANELPGTPKNHLVVGRKPRPFVRENGAVNFPDAGVHEPFDVDTLWSASTWLAKVPKPELIYLLQSVGEYKDGMAKWTGRNLSQYMVIVREKRAKAKALNSTAAPKKEDAAIKHKTSFHQQNPDSDEMTLTNASQDATTTAIPKKRKQQSRPKPNILPTISTNLARAHLYSIKQQAIIDTRRLPPIHDDFPMTPNPYTSDSAPPARDTILRDEKDNVIFSYEAQIAVRRILEFRSALRAIATEGLEGSYFRDTQGKFQAACKGLAGEVAGWLAMEEDGVLPADAAVDMVEEYFRI
ncbi:hypothetical protein BDU57DRAFT_536870 [Ampelomyces quisqualis]|uniref:Uncharacterized protein n=1 Tax=Ampelomyces quisqualis TaxID=50730 RepID=A0A6A5QZ38_AMPQU|nr:hypothetical protein BDU57DRAFT_536870 [Ampelomyces quisqualis]